MKGSNPIRPQQLNAEGRLWVQEIFYTLQGEGPFNGQPALFIRLAGCNLRCYWCDTDFESSTWQPDLRELLNVIDSKLPHHCRLAVITGGEPFRQNIQPLVAALLDRDLQVQLETNGTLWIDLPDDPRLTIVVSPKTKYIHDQILKRAQHFKYVLAHNQIDRVDGLPISSTQRQNAGEELARPPAGASVFVMPLDEGDTHLNQLNTRQALAVAKEFGYKLTLQTHKILDIE